MQVGITFANLPLEVIGDYIPKTSGSRFEPPEGGYIDQITIMLGDHDITDIISQKDLEEIERLALQEAGL